MQEFREEPTNTTTLARVDLFHIDNTKPLVEEVRRYLFYRLVYYLIYYTSRS